MPSYRKKPVVVEAIRWTGENWIEIVGRFGARDVRWDPDSHSLLVTTLEGRMRCSAGDWLISGVKDELYPCKPDVFEATYERVVEAEHVFEAH